MEDFDNSTISTDQGLLQVKPETSRDEQMAFIDTMRGIQGGQNQEIQDTTHALGSDVTPEFGGINGTNSYWLSRYQTPQTESRIATMRTAAQSSALNTALNNYLNRLQEDYNKAYRRANKRERNRARAAMYGSGGGNDPSNPEGKGKVKYTDPDKVPVGSAGTTVPIKGRRTESFLDGNGDWVTRDIDTGATLFVNGVNIAQATLNDITKGAAAGGTNKANRTEQRLLGGVLSQASPIVGGIYKVINGLF